MNRERRYGIFFIICILFFLMSCNTTLRLPSEKTETPPPPAETPTLENPTTKPASPPPNTTGSLSKQGKTSTLNNAFDKLHQYSNDIYRSQKIASISETSFKESTQRWDEGSWGRGYFSWFVDIPEINNSGKSNENAYLNWYKANGNKFWGAHPLIRDTARRIVAYIYQYRSGDKQSDYKAKIERGLQYLVHQQTVNISKANFGSFVTWTNRPAKDQVNIDETMAPNFGTVYSTGLAVRALVEGHFFLEQEGWSDIVKKKDIELTVSRAADWLVKHTKNYDTGSIQKVPAKASGSPVNYRAFALWGLTSAYRMTQDLQYLNRAAEVYLENIAGYQDTDGAWYYNYASGEKFHDTAPGYMGITLRSLADLYDVIPENLINSNKTPDLTDDNIAQLKRQIILTIDHFMAPGNGAEPKTGTTSTRLSKEGFVLPYKKMFAESRSHAKTHPGNELILGLYYAYQCNDLFESEEKRESIRQLMETLVERVAILAQKNITTSSDVWMNCIAHFNANVWFDDYE